VSRRLVLAGVVPGALAAAALAIPAVATATEQMLPTGLLPSLSVAIGGERLTTPLQVVALLTLLSLAPAVLVTLTAFVRIVIVLSFLRQAVGTQSMPPNQVVVSLALFLTAFVMMPVAREINTQALLPYQASEISDADALGRAWQPLRQFMLRQTREKDLALFVGATGAARPATADEITPQVLLPAFLISELKTAFQMGFLIYIPFLILDLVVASVLTSMGMITLPPALISLPFKLMLFVLVDGWNVLTGSLVQSFR
jgi:flagellar biosynthesis protein FliP